MTADMDFDIITGERFQGIAEVTITSESKLISHVNHDFLSRISFCILRQNSDGSIALSRNDLQKVRSASIIFIYGDFIDLFFLFIIQEINHPFVLISHNSDQEITHRYRSHLDNRHLKRWYAQNVMPGFTHDKLVSIPIGLGNAQWEHGNLAEFARLKAEKSDRDILLYANFSTGTNRIQREGIRRILAETDFSLMEGGVSTIHYWRNIRRSRFVASPRGNGVDCHRTWEALYLGAVPILDHEDRVGCLEGLPVLETRNWRELGRETLNRTWEEIMKKPYNYERLRFSYWKHRIEADAEHAKGQ